MARVNRSNRRSAKARRSPGLLSGRILPKGLVGLAQIALVLGMLVGPAFVASVAAANPSADLDQCANDPAPSPHTDGCSAAATDWVNGNLNAAKSVYLEGDSIPYRMVLDNLTLASHTLTISWDTTKGGKHALDYITTYNRTVATADPCLGIAACGAPSTFPIPTDPQVTGAGVNQIAGDLTIFGGAITGVSAYSYPDGAGFAGDKSASITITFVPTQANPVIAWGGHIATRADWGLNNSAVAISGSPYHTSLVALDGAGGAQDRSLSADAVVFPASIHIIKNTVGGNGTFNFTASPAPLSNFSITTVGGTGNQDFDNITNFQTYTVAEGALPLNFTFTSLVCSVTSANGGTQTVNGVTATIDLKEGENVTCTYTNTAQAANLAVTKVADAASVSAGTAIGYTVTITNNGAGTATGVTLTDNLPGGNAGTPVTWSIDAAAPGTTPAAFSLTGAAGAQVLSLAGQPITLAPGASVSVHVTAPTTAQSCATYNNTATVNSTNDGNPVAGPVGIVVNCGQLLITKVADASPVNAGDPIGYVITITNNGAGTVTGVTASDTLPTAPPGLSWSIDVPNSSAGWTINGGVLSFGPQDLAPGASTHVHITSPTTAQTCGTVNNAASATSRNDGNPQTALVPIVVNCPSLVITKVADAANVPAGQQIGYTITITNNGPGLAKGVTVSDTLPTTAGLAWTIDAANSSPGWTILAGVLAFGPADLAAGASSHVHIVSPTTQASCGTIFNSATVNAANGGPVNVGRVPIGVNCPVNPALLVEKGVSLSPGGPFVSSVTTTVGTTVYYRITVTNTGNTTLTGITLKDTLGLPASCVIPSTLAPGASFTCDYTRVATAGTTVNTATADSDQTDPASDSATVVAPALATPTPTPTATATPTPTPTPTPTGTVAGVTSPPKPIVTLPPTDTVGPAVGASGNSTMILFGLMLISLAAIIFMSDRRRRMTR
jgi:uncharacterized repeat protein (TIGR01451 family)